jgi:hypothetical protein
VNATDPVCDEAVSSSCLALQCDEAHLVHRDRLDEKRELERQNSAAAQQPTIQIGAVASGDSVIKSATHRDRIAAKENVIAFEMEGAGVWDEVPCIVVKGDATMPMLRQRRLSSSATPKLTKTMVGRGQKQGPCWIYSTRASAQPVCQCLWAARHP